MKKLFWPLPILSLLLLPLLFNACQPTAEPIDYGADLCEFCKMTIVDEQHAAEVVSSKGRAFKFDAIECMANYLEQNGNTKFPILLVNDYHSPRKLIDAETASYLISKNLPSPMGAFLTAFGQKTTAVEMQNTKGGEVFDWQSLNSYLREQGVVKQSKTEY